MVPCHWTVCLRLALLLLSFSLHSSIYTADERFQPGLSTVEQKTYERSSPFITFVTIFVVNCFNKLFDCRWPLCGLLLSKHAIEMFVLNLRNSSCFAHWNSRKKRKRSIKDGPSAGSQTRPGGNTHYLRPHNEEGRENPPPTGLLRSKHAIEMFVLNLRNSSCFMITQQVPTVIRV